MMTAVIPTLKEMQQAVDERDHAMSILRTELNRATKDKVKVVQSAYDVLQAFKADVDRVRRATKARPERSPTRKRPRSKKTSPQVVAIRARNARFCLSFVALALIGFIVSMYV